MRTHLARAMALSSLALCTSTSAQEISSSALLKPASATAFDNFGAAVAVSGDRLIVGSPLTLVGGQPQGSATIYLRNAAGAWVADTDLVLPLAQIPNPTGMGTGVAIQGDLAAIGGPDLQSAEVVVYRKGLAGWAFEATIDPPVAGAGGLGFGSALAFTGSQLLVTNPKAGFPSAPSLSGAVHVFESAGVGSWSLVQTLTASDIHADAHFGYDLDVEGDRIVVGTQHVSGLLGSTDGIAYVFERDASGVWTETAKLTDSLGVASSTFGNRVGLGGDQVFVSDSLEPIAPGRTGTVSVFQRSTSGSYSLLTRLDSPLDLPSEEFGTSVETDGERLFVGAAQNFASFPQSNGMGYLFAPGAGGWTFSAHLVEETTFDAFGNPYDTLPTGVALLAGGELLLPERIFAGFFPLYNVAVFDVDELMPSTDSISLAAGGTQDLYLRPGTMHAGETYITLGSLSGTTPGFALPGTALVLPLVPDAYTLFLLGNPAAGTLLPGHVGVIDADGFGETRVVLPGGSSPALAGLAVDHAYVLIGSTGFTFASGAEPLVLEP